DLIGGDQLALVAAKTGRRHGGPALQPRRRVGDDRDGAMTVDRPSLRTPAASAGNQQAMPAEAAAAVEDDAIQGVHPLDGGEHSRAPTVGIHLEDISWCLLGDDVNGAV